MRLPLPALRSAAAERPPLSTRAARAPARTVEESRRGAGTSRRTSSGSRPPAARPARAVVSRMNRISSAATSARDGASSTPSMISRSVHGLPCAARPTMTASAPVLSRISSARWCETTSPEATTGTSTSSTSSAVRRWSASPVYICRADRGCRVRLPAPASTSCGPSERHVREPFSRPRRIFTVTGTDTASATAPTIRQARSGCSSSVAPAPVFVTLRTGQPKLMSTRSAPAASTICAASAINAGSEPKICTASGRSSSAMRR